MSGRLDIHAYAAAALVAYGARLPDPVPAEEPAPTTRQQRRAAERAARKSTPLNDGEGLS